MNTGIRAIIFDLDGTLYPMTKRFKPMFALFSLPHPLRLPGYMKLRDSFRGEARNSGSEIMAEINKKIEETFKIKSGQKWQEKEFYPAFYATLSATRKRPELDKLLKSLHDKKYRLVVLSDFGNVWERLTALDIDTSLFEHLLSSEDLGGFKPHTRPFEQTLKILNLPPEQVLMVGDREETDGDGARAMNMPFLKVPGKSNKGWRDSIQPLFDLPTVEE